MKSTVSLYEFMPYGAPELIESRHRHLSRALVLTSVSSLVLCAMTGGLASRIHVPSVELHGEVAHLGPHIVTPPPLVPHAPVAPPIPIARPAPGPAVPVPVPDDVAPPDAAPPAPQVDGSVPGRDGAATGKGVTSIPGESVIAPPVFSDYVEELPSVVKEVTPEYPQMAREAGIEGLVLVRVLVGTNGRVLDVRLSERHQIPLLNEAALVAARKWVFTPGLANGRAVTCWTAIPFRFRLH